MSAVSNEDRLIGRVVKDGSLQVPLEKGVRPDYFVDPEARAVWEFILRHESQYGNVPTGFTLRDNFPTFVLVHSDEPVEFFVDQMLAYRRSTKTYAMVAEAVEIMADPAAYDKALQMLARRMAELEEDVVDDTDLDLTVDPTDRLDDYARLAEATDGLLGLPTGFPTIDRATAGLQRGQLVSIVASPKTGKSVLALKVAEHVHSQGYSVMYQSFEMSNVEQQQRHDAIRAQISHNRLRRGMLSEAEEQRYRQMLESLEGTPPFILSDSTVGVTVSALSAKIAKHDPDLVVVDGIYLMIDEVTGESNTPQSLTNVTRSMKRMAQRLNKPIVVTTQALLWKMRGTQVTANSIGYSSSLLQDSDVVLGLERIEDEEFTRNLKIVESRNCGPATVPLTWDWEAGRFFEIGFTDGEGEPDDEGFEYDLGMLA